MTLNPLTIFRRWLFNRSRFIFTYWNGNRIVTGDPMTIWRALQQHEDFREDDFKLMKVAALRDRTIGKLAGIVRDVFSVKTPDAGGLTELECIDLLKAFLVYSGFQKKSTEQTPTLQPITEQKHSDDLQTPETNTSDVSDSI
jgi:hypothetical protein